MPHDFPALILVRWPKKREELEDGYIFRYEGDENRFLTVAKWASDEHRCCPWATIAVEAGPSVEGKSAVIKLRWGGRMDGKEFLAETPLH